MLVLRSKYYSKEQRNVYRKTSNVGSNCTVRRVAPRVEYFHLKCYLNSINSTYTCYISLIFSSNTSIVDDDDECAGLDFVASPTFRLFSPAHHLIVVNWCWRVRVLRCVQSYRVIISWSLG